MACLTSPFVLSSISRLLSSNPTTGPGAQRREPGLRSYAYTEPSGTGIGSSGSRRAPRIKTPATQATFAEFLARGTCMDVERSTPERPLVAYGAILAAYILTFVGPLAVAARRGVLPVRPRFADLALVGAGTFKLSRLLTTDAVTGFIRAPFVRYEGMEGVSTPKESPRGRVYGARSASCCSARPAPASGSPPRHGALVAAPRATRVACGALTVAAASDFLQSAHRAAAQDDEGSEDE